MTPPKALKATPASGQKNFTGDGFVVEFDEYVVLKDAESNILVSPPMNPKPEYKVNGKKLKVKLNDSLQKDVTYVFQFKGAIVDFTEGNPLPSMVYAFSTGNDIDTMMICGSVLDAFTNKPRQKPVSVMAYDKGDDSVVANGTPLYITRCDPEGNFAFDFIRPGNYRIVALEDADRNLKFNGDEAIAFLDSTVASQLRLSDSASKYERESFPRIAMRMSALEKSVQRVTKAEFLKRGRIEIVTKEPMKKPKIDNKDLVWHLNKGGDTLSVWLRNEQQDSARFILTDPSGLNDTLKLQFRERRQAKNKVQRNEPKSAPLMKSLIGSLTAPFDTLWVTFDNPVTAPKCDSVIQVMNLKDSSLSNCSIALDKSGLRAQILLKGKAGLKYKISIPKGIFTDLYGHPSDSISITTEIATMDKFGNIYLMVSMDELEAHAKAGQLLLQLTNESGKVQQEQRVPISHFSTPDAANKVGFEHLKPAKYKVQIIIDANNNGQWDAGDYWKHLQPERVYYFEKTLELRENWDIEEKVNIAFE